MRYSWMKRTIVHSYNYLFVFLTDAFMDFTSGILSVTGINATGHIFASYPGRHLSVLGGFIDQVSSGRCDTMTSTSVVNYMALPLRLLILQSLANAANAQLIAPFNLRTPPLLLSFGSNDPFPGIHREVKSILNTIFSLFRPCSDPKITRLPA